MRMMKRGLVAVMVAGSMAGGALGATVMSAASGAAATTTQATGTGAPPPGGAAPGGRFVPNEEPAHEKSESAQREAEESEGKFPKVP